MRLPMCVGMARMAMAMLALTGCTQAERHDPVFVSQEALTPPAPQRPVYVAASDEGDVDLSPLTGAQRAVDGSGLGAWSAPASYTSAFTARSGMSTGVYDAQAYFVGGTDANGPLTDVWIVGFLPNGGIDPTTAVQGTSLPGSGLSQHAGVAYAANLYVAGGYDPGNGVALGAVMVSPLDIDGSMGAWATTTPLPGLRANPAMVAHDGALYVIGGDNGGSTLYPDVFRAALNPDGTLGSWTAVTSLPVATTGAAAAVFGDSLYVLGGQTAGGASANVEVATFQSDGTLSSWVTLPSFTGARTHARAAATRGNLFLVGGNGVSDVQSAPIEPNGNLGTWAEMPGFPAVRGSFALVESQGVLTAVGGTNGSNPYGDSLYASVATYGVRGNWQDAGTLAAGSAAAAVVFNGFVYLVAGPSPGDSTDVQFAALGPDATPGTFSSAETGGPLPVALSYAGAIGYNGYLYVIGGNNTLSISKAPFLTAGGLGAWVDAGTLPESDSIFQPVISDGQLFLAGTANLGGGVTPNSQIDETTIAADGTLGTWSALTRSGGGYSAQFNAGTFAARGNLYILGGIADGSSGYPEGGVFANVCSTIVQYAPITPSGLGALTQIQLPSNQYTCGRMATYDDYWFLEGLISGWGASGPVIADGGVPLQDGYGQAPESTQMEGYGAYNGSLLILGGFRGTGTTTGIYTAPLGLPGALGPWTLSTAMSGLTETTNRTGGVAVSNRGWIYVVGGFGSKGVSLNDVVVAAAYTDGGVGTWQASPDTFTTGRTGHAVAVMNDQLYVAGGLSDAPAVLSDVQVAPLYSDGGVGVFTPAGTLPMGVGRTNLSLVATSTALYAIGGLNSGGNALSSVATAAIGAGGTLGAWTNTGAGSFLKQPRENHTSLVHNGYVYVIGGDNVTSLLNSVEVAPLSATSGLGAFTTTTDLSVGRVGHGLAAYGGQLYILGGCANLGGSKLPISCPLMLQSVQSAPFLGDGTLGGWTEMASLSGSNAPRVGMAVTQANGFLYAIAGTAASLSAKADVRVSAISAPAPTGSMSKLIDLGADALTVDDLILEPDGGNPAARGVFHASMRLALTTDAGFGPTIDVGTIAAGSTTLLGEGPAHYVWLDLGFDDSDSVTLEPQGSTPRSLTGMQVDFTPCSSSCFPSNSSSSSAASTSSSASSSSSSATSTSSSSGASTSSSTATGTSSSSSSGASTSSSTATGTSSSSSGAATVASTSSSGAAISAVTTASATASTSASASAGTSSSGTSSSPTSASSSGSTSSSVSSSGTSASTSTVATSSASSSGSSGGHSGASTSGSTAGASTSGASTAASTSSTGSPSTASSAAASGTAGTTSGNGATSGGASSSVKNGSVDALGCSSAPSSAFAPWAALALIFWGRRRHGWAVVSVAVTLLPFSAQASPKRPRIAITQLQATVGVDPKVSQVVTNQLASKIQTRTGAQVVSPADIEAQIGLDRTKKLMGCTDGSCMAEIAGALGVDLLVSGSLAKVGNSIAFDAALIDTTKCAVIRRYSNRIKGGSDDEFLDEAERAAAGLFPPGTTLAGDLAGVKAPDPDLAAATPPGVTTTPAVAAPPARVDSWEVGLGAATELTAKGGWGSLSAGRRFGDSLAVAAVGHFTASKGGGFGAEAEYVPLFASSWIHPVVGLEVPVLFVSQVLVGVVPRVAVEAKPTPSTAIELGVPFAYFFVAPAQERPWYLLAQLTAKLDF